MVKYPALLSITATATIAVLAGCGGNGASETAGSDGSPSGSGGAIATSSLTRAEFVKKANAICDRATNLALAQLSLYVKQHGGGGAPPREGSVLARAFAAILPASMKAQIAQIRALGAPAGDEERVKTFLQVWQRAVAKLEANPPSSDREFNPMFARVEKLGQAYGFEGCAY
jgi:hypothetical protein